jgi:hypothetical protein
VSRDFLAIPFASATSLDSTLAGSSKAGVQKLRVSLTDLGAGQTVSLGRRGTVQIANTALLPCLTTAYRWDRERGEHLSTAYLQSGMRDLLKSKAYLDNLALVVEAIKEAAAKGPFDRSNTTLVSQTVAGLVRSNQQMRIFAGNMTEICERVDRKVHQVRVLPGQVERIEGDDALLTVHVDGHEELRRARATYLASSGIQNRGDAFLMHELSWSEDALVRLFVPAVDLRTPADAGEVSRLSQELAAAETPLPRPSSLGQMAVKVRS